VHQLVPTISEVDIGTAIERLSDCLPLEVVSCHIGDEMLIFSNRPFVVSQGRIEIIVIPLSPLARIAVGHLGGDVKPGFGPLFLKKLNESAIFIWSELNLLGYAEGARTSVGTVRDRCN
jgi:hypothetical protein